MESKERAQPAYMYLFPMSEPFKFSLTGDPTPQRVACINGHVVAQHYRMDALGCFAWSTSPLDLNVALKAVRVDMLEAMSTRQPKDIAAADGILVISTGRERLVCRCVDGCWRARVETQEDSGDRAWVPVQTPTSPWKPLAEAVFGDARYTRCEVRWVDGSDVPPWPSL